MHFWVTTITISVLSIGLNAYLFSNHRSLYAKTEELDNLAILSLFPVLNIFVLSFGLRNLTKAFDIDYKKLVYFLPLASLGLLYFI